MKNYGLGSYLKTRTKKAIKLTPEEKGYVKKVKSKIKSTPKKITQYGSRVDFGNLWGTPLRKPVPIKKRKKISKTSFVVIGGVKYKAIKSRKKKR